MTCFPSQSVHDVNMPTMVAIPVPDTLFLHSKNLPALEQRSRFLLALKYFELGELTRSLSPNTPLPSLIKPNSSPPALF